MVGVVVIGEGRPPSIDGADRSGWEARTTRKHTHTHTHTHERSRRLSGGDEQLRGFGIFNGLSGQPDQCVAANWLREDVRCRRSFRCFVIIFVEFSPPPYYNNNIIIIIILSRPLWMCVRVARLPSLRQPVFLARYWKIICNYIFYSIPPPPYASSVDFSSSVLWCHIYIYIIRVSALNTHYANNSHFL